MSRTNILEISDDELLARFVGGIFHTVYQLTDDEAHVFRNINKFKFVPQICEIFEDQGLAKKGSFTVQLNIFDEGKHVGYYCVFLHHVCSVESAYLGRTCIEIEHISSYFEYAGEVYSSYDDLLMIFSWESA